MNISHVALQKLFALSKPENPQLHNGSNKNPASYCEKCMR